jgi:hypothetical protein
VAAEADIIISTVEQVKVLMALVAVAEQTVVVAGLVQTTTVLVEAVVQEL